MNWSQKQSSYNKKTDEQYSRPLGDDLSISITFSSTFFHEIIYKW